MNAYKTTLEPGDDLQLTLPEEFRNKKVEVIVLEVEEEQHTAPQPRKPLDFVPMGIDVEKYPFDRGILYDENGRI